MPAVLWHIEISHYNEKARWALDYKRVAHSRRAPLPGLTAPIALALTRGDSKRMPILDLAGVRVAGSSAIVQALERHRPDPPLLPADPSERARALALEELFDEQLAPAVRRLFWHHTLGDARATADAILTRAGPARKALARTLTPAFRPLVRRDYDVGAHSAPAAVATIRATMDRIENELGDGDYLAGARFSVADLAGAALFTPLLCPPGRQYGPPALAAPLLELRAELEARPGGQWVNAMFARHRGPSAAISSR